MDLKRFRFNKWINPGFRLAEMFSNPNPIRQVLSDYLLCVTAVDNKHSALRLHYYYTYCT